MAARCGDSSVVSKPVEGDLGDICAQAWERGVVDCDGDYWYLTADAVGGTLGQGPAAHADPRPPVAVDDALHE